MVPSPRRVGFIRPPPTAPKCAEITPGAIRRAPLIASATVHQPIDLLTPVPEPIRIEDIDQLIWDDIDSFAIIRNSGCIAGKIDHPIAVDETILPGIFGLAITIIWRFRIFAGPTIHFMTPRFGPDSRSQNCSWRSTSLFYAGGRKYFAVRSNAAPDGIVDEVRVIVMCFLRCFVWWFAPEFDSRCASGWR